MIRSLASQLATLAAPLLLACARAPSTAPRAPARTSAEQTRAPDDSLSTSMSWSRFELHCERRRGRWELDHAANLDGSDCTNC